MKDCISRQATLEPYKDLNDDDVISVWLIRKNIEQQPPVNPQELKTGHCKDCRYFEHDVFMNVDGIPLIVAHQICSRWGGGCGTRENGYCYMFEPQERSEE